jgi:hypothetical protein
MRNVRMSSYALVNNPSPYRSFFRVPPLSLFVYSLIYLSVHTMHALSIPFWSRVHLTL